MKRAARKKAATKRSQTAKSRAVAPEDITPVDAAPVEILPALVASAAGAELDDAKKRAVIAILSVGCSRQTAAQYVGCTPRTIARAATEDPEFADQIQKAESLHEIGHLKHIDAAAQDARHWRAAAWALERMHPERYAPRKPHGLTDEQVRHALDGFAAVIVEEIAEPDVRQRIVARLDRLIQELVEGDDGQPD